MYFVKRGTRYHDVSGMSFRDLLAGKLQALPGVRATLSDWANHLSTIFPEVRLKRYLEMRGQDVGSAEMITALGALFAGLLYDGAALSAASDLVLPWSAEMRQSLREAVPVQGLAAEIGGRDLLDISREVLAIARSGPAGSARSRRNAVSRAAGRPRRARPNQGRDAARTVPRTLGGERGPGLHGMRLLTVLTGTRLRPLTPRPGRGSPRSDPISPWALRAWPYFCAGTAPDGQVAGGFVANGLAMK